MKDKVLYSSAIISDELYVERDADRKLRQVIQRMSKPAYISVARQMGKTNLLIHTKRALEDANNRYVYIDITSDFNTSQDCFRYIVNQILNSNEELAEFQLAKEIILNSRKESKINASEEYQNEIREILKHYKGNLIVFLDEVDDLRKHSFSDDIFGQIRKTYFIRETYSSLKRIAYILSGVIDPEKLIKTKENSPFNIAIPIYLEDFNRNEFYELVYKSNLELDNNIKDYIFDWLSGNPRMSFEILSLVEDYYINGLQITNELVDEIINDFYLTNFKNPPIDHIRDVVNSNTDVRRALIKLKNGLLEELSDEDINKFYLFGITASKINRQSLKIKNKVLELSLSNEWLSKIELQKKGYYVLGNEKIKQGDFLGGIKYLEEYILNEPNGAFVKISNYNIGKAYHENGDYELSNKYLLKRPIDIESSFEVYYMQISYIGINYFRLGLFDEALMCYDEIINDNKLPQSVMNAYANKGEALIKADKKYEVNFIINIYLSALEYLKNNSQKIVEQNTFKTLMYFRLGSLYYFDKKRIEAKDFFEKAKTFSKVEEKPIILLSIDNCVLDDIEARVAIYKELYDLIISNKLVFEDSENLSLPFIDVHIFIILSNLYEFGLIDKFDSLFSYCIEIIYNKEIKEYKLLFDVAMVALNSQYISVCEILMSRILTYENIDLQIKMRCNQFLGLIANNKKEEKSISYFENYVVIFKDIAKNQYELNENDFHCFIILIDHYRIQRNFVKSFETASIIENQFTEEMNLQNKTYSVTVLFFIMDLYSIMQNYSIAEDYAERILSRILEMKPSFNELHKLDVNELLHYETQTKLFLQNLRADNVKSNKILVKQGKEPSRNEIVNVEYTNGKKIKVKYKKVILDIKDGKCKLIN